MAASTDAAAAADTASAAATPSARAGGADVMELTLIVAATRGMGIGRAGTLPWAGLRKEMAYFARVTRRPPAGAPPAAVNAVVMGRKTWDSIPPRFRPLKGRLNVVLSRTAAAAGTEKTGHHGGGGGDDASADTSVVHARSLPEALEYLGRLRSSAADTSDGGSGGGGGREDGSPPPLGRVFVIGGAQIYDAALALPGAAAARRVLLTSILTDFECDTAVSALSLEDGGAWKRASKEQLDAWVGETVPEGVQEENGTSYEFQMWERVGEGSGN